MLANPTGYGPFGHNTVGKLINSLAHVRVWQGATVAVALGTVAVLTVFPVDQTRRDLGMLAALVIVAVVVSVFHISAESVGHIASIPSSFPAAVAPDWSAIPRLLLGGFAISLVALAQAAGISARSPTPMAASLPRAGQALANLDTGFFRALPAGGSLSRTAGWPSPPGHGHGGPGSSPAYG